VGDAIAGVCVLTCVSMMIMVTAGTVILGEPASNIATLALTIQPLLGPTAFVVFCIGLIPIALNPFLINAMIGGTALADGLGFPGRFSDFWPRMFTIGVLIVGFIVATVGLWFKIPPVNLMIFGQAMTVIGNPLLAATILWLANRKTVMGERRNRFASNVLGAIGLTVVLLLTVRMLWFLYLRISLLLAAFAVFVVGDDIAFPFELTGAAEVQQVTDVDPGGHPVTQLVVHLENSLGNTNLR
jgi:manganese transport protein